MNTVFLWGFSCLVVIVILIVLKRRRDIALLKTVTALHRGTVSEQELVLKLLRYGIPPSAIFHDLYVQKSRSAYSQIDVVAVTPVGIIVFEVKEYSGSIYGNGCQSYWTQVLAHSKQKYSFYNPIMQNNSHIEALKTKLAPFADVPLYSVIVFYGKCVFRDIRSVPEGVFLLKSYNVFKVIDTILKNNPDVNKASLEATVEVLQNAVQNGDCAEIRAKHIENINYISDRNSMF